MFRIRHDIYLDEYVFACSSCGCGNVYYPERPTPRVCRVCQVKLFPRLDDIQESMLYRTLYHYAKEDSDGSQTEEKEGKSIRQSGDI